MFIESKTLNQRRKQGVTQIIHRPVREVICVTEDDSHYAFEKIN